MPRKHHRANETQVIYRKESRMIKWEAKRGLPAKQSANAGRTGLPAFQVDLSPKDWS